MAYFQNKLPLIPLRAQVERLTAGPACQVWREGRETEWRLCFAGAHAGEERFLGESRGIERERGSRRTCLYPWLDERWSEQPATKLTSGGCGRVSTEWGGPRGCNTTRRYQWTFRESPEQLLELEGHRSKEEGLQGSLVSSVRDGG